MYRSVRSFHKIVGLGLAVLLILVGITGALLAMKSVLPWMRPPTLSGSPVQTPAQVVSIERVVQAALQAGVPQMRSLDEIERIDYRPNKNVFKVISGDTLWEVQVDGKTGKVLSKSFRTDQFVENVHDLSALHEMARVYGMPFVGLGLVLMAATGLAIYFVPIVRRRRHRAARGSGSEQ